MSKYHIAGNATVFVIGAEGKIRFKKAFGEILDQIVEELVVEAEVRNRVM